MEDILIFIKAKDSKIRTEMIETLSEYYKSNVTIELFEYKIQLMERLSIIQPHVLIVLYELFDFSITDDLIELKKNCLNLLVITESQSTELISNVINCGISNYILALRDQQELMGAIHATIAKRKYYSSEILDVILAQKPQSNNEHITHAEEKIIKLIAQGYNSREIALQKNLSYHTITSHRKNIFRKIGISNVSELLIYAIRTGMIDSSKSHA